MAEDRSLIIDDYVKAAKKADEFYGRKIMNLTDDVLRAISENMFLCWDHGRSIGLEEAHKIVNEVVYKLINDDLKKNPKMSLKTFAKKHGFLEEEKERFDV